MGQNRKITHQDELEESGLVKSSAEILVPRDDIVCASLVLLVVAGR